MTAESTPAPVIVSELFSLTYTPRFDGKLTADADGWEHFAWDCTITARAGAAPATATPVVIRTEYRKGSAHVEWVRAGNGTGKAVDLSRVDVHGKRAWIRGGGTELTARGQAPTVEEVMASLSLDAEAVDLSFPDWADSFGYDSDSIKAREIYDACTKVGHELRDLCRSIGVSVAALSEWAAEQ